MSHMYCILVQTAPHTVARLLLQEEVWQHDHTLPCLCALYSVHQSDCRVQLRHVNGYIRDQICAQVVVAVFNKALMLLREEWV